MVVVSGFEFNNALSTVWRSKGHTPDRFY
jgi:hypothetical protein